jgi:outer membrane receptor protein involved in Fe transport
MKLTTRQRLLASTLLIGAASLATPAWAQDTTPEAPVSSAPDPTTAESEAASEDGDQEIVVTGSRISRRDLTSTSPLAVVQDEEFKLSGAVNVEQVINTLPQVIPGATAFSNNPGGGVATLNLRGLGTQRNLVLVNGRRYIFFDPTQVTDLNTIPSFLLDSVDVVTGGASAVYGSDALAGVTNFHLRNDLSGMLIGGQASLTGKGDGPRYDLYAAIGTDFADGRGNVTVYGEYFKRGDIFQDARNFSTFALGDGDGELIPLGSAGVPQGRFPAIGGSSLAVGAGSNCDPDEGPLVSCFPIATGTNYTGLGAFFGTPGVSTPYSSATDSYNYAPANYLMVPQTRWTLGGYGEYEITDGVTAYGEVAFVNNKVENELAATPITQRVYVGLAEICGYVSADDCADLTQIAANQQAAIAAGSTAFGAFNAGAGSFNALQPDEVALTANYRFTQIGARNNTDDRNAYRLVGGVRGDITSDLNYDLYYMYSRTKNSQVQTGNVSRSAFVENVEDGTCNIYGLNQLSQECMDNLSILAQNQEESTLQVVQGSISGNAPFTFPWAQEPVGFAVGAEYRSMNAQFIPDTALSSGDVAGFNAGDPTGGGYNVKELFGEVRIPIIEEHGIHKLELNGAARYSDYSLDAVGGVWTYAAGAEFAPIQDITFRGQYQRAVRAPSVGELFGGQAVGFPPATDPCAVEGAEDDAALSALCVATGVPATSVGDPDLQPNAQIEGVFGGNPNLEEEVGDTYTFGAIIQPRFIPRLNIAIDWYKIKVANTIAVAGGSVNQILNLCYNVIQDAGHVTCQSVLRDPSGQISGGGEFVVLALNENLAQLDTQGIDFQVDYNMPLDFGLVGESSRLSFFLLGNHQWENSFTPIAGVDQVVECAGNFGLNCGDPTPKWKWTTRLSWADGPLTTSIRWRYLGSVDDDDPETDFVVDELDSYNVFDLAFAFDVTDNATFNFGINNLFNKKPPIMGDNQEQANTYPGTYDVLGRDFFVSASFRL